MKQRWLFAPVAALVVFAGYLGLRMGQPLTETDLITHFARSYVETQGNGAALTDCLAMPSAHPDVRLIVVCSHPNGEIFTYPSGPRGQLRDIGLDKGGV